MKHYKIERCINPYMSDNPDYDTYDVYERGFLRYHFLKSFSTKDKAYKYINDINYGVHVIIREIE